HHRGATRRDRQGYEKMNMRSTIAVAVLVARGLTAQARPAIDAHTLTDYLDRAAAFGFSGAVIVAEGNTPIVAAGYGLADRDRARPITLDSPFYVASITKQFIAAGIMRLDMMGKLSTSDTIGRFFRGLPPMAAAISIDQLLTHTAGTPRYAGLDTGAAAF